MPTLEELIAERDRKYAEYVKRRDKRWNDFSLFTLFIFAIPFVFSVAGVVFYK